MTLKNRIALLALATSALAHAAQAQTVVEQAWVRATVPQQRATALFGRITSAGGGRLVAAASPVAGVVEVHEMSMQGDVMRMRAVPALELPAGQPVDLTPGGYHVMLLDLKQSLKLGDTVAVNFVVEGPDGRRETVAVQAPVRALGAMGGMKH